MTNPVKVLLLLFVFLDTQLLFAQSPRIAIKEQDVSLAGVIEEIERLTDYTFLYSDAHIRRVDHLKLEFRNAKITEVLEHCLKDTDLTYRIEDKTIILIPVTGKKPETAEIQNDRFFRLWGRVRDEKGTPLSGVNIYVKNAPGMGIASNETGNFAIYVRRGDMVVFSSVGYSSVEFSVIDFSSSVDIVLQKSQEKLEEIQVVGYGVERKVSTVGAISDFNAGNYSFPLTSFSNAITGAISGIIGVQRSGEPGEDVSEFWIRGISTFGAGEKALILIDGVERSTFNDLVAEDIESFSVLKDATATAVYGARGANGVILVKTRRGAAGRMRVEANGKYMMSCLPRLPDYLGAYDYALLVNEAKQVRGEKVLYDNASLDVIKYGLDPDIYPDVNWQKELLKKWSRGAQVNLSCSGGGDIARYYISGNYRTNDAAYRESGVNSYHTNVLRRQYSFRTNLDVNVTSSTFLSVDFATNIVSMNRPGIGKTDRLWQIQADLNPLVVPKRYSNGAFPCYGENNQVAPTVLLNETGYVSEFKNNIETKLGVSQDLHRFIPGFKVSAAIAYDSYTAHTASREKMPELYKAKGRDAQGRLILDKVAEKQNISYTELLAGNRMLYFEAKADYNRNIRSFRFGGLLLFNLSNRSVIQDTGLITSIPQKFMGVAGRVTASYRDIYFSEFNFGYNGSGNFPKKRRFGLFPSIAVGWMPSEYSFWKKHIARINVFKLKYSFGLVGNDQILNTRFPFITYVDINAPGYSFGDYAQNTVPGISIQREGSENLRWERAVKQNLGIEIGFADRLGISFDYYRDLRKGIFMQRGKIPDIMGVVSRPYGNIGRMQNWGYEGTVVYTDGRGAWSWELRGNFTYTDHKILDYDEIDNYYSYQNHKGKRLNVMRGFVALGYFRDSSDILNSPKHLDLVRPGDIKYKDVNGDGVIDDNDIVPIGNSSVPRLQYGFAGNVKWKGWDLGIFFRGAGAVDYVLGGSGYAPFIDSEVGNVLRVVGDSHNRWIPAWYSGDAVTENPDARFPRLSYGPNKNNYRASTHWLVNGAYLRLKTLEIGYSFPFSILNKWQLTKLRISLTGDNLRVWDHVRLWDPEQASANGAVYPLSRSFMLNVQLGL